MTNNVRFDRPRRLPRAFTLTEVMISLALVLVVILGVNQVFSLANQAISSGTTLSGMNRLSRQVQTVLGSDLKNADTRFFFIASEVLPAFSNREDLQSDKDYNPVTMPRVLETERAIRTIDRDGNGSDADPADLTPTAILGKRLHRSDKLKFFSRFAGRKQTGDAASGTFASTVASGEHFLCYGHLQIPHNNSINLTTGVAPGIGPITAANNNALTPANNNNSNNYFASDWVLGRNDYLLREPRLVSGAWVITDSTSSNTRMTYYGRSRGSVSTGSSATLSPFSLNSQMTSNGTGFSSTSLVQYSTYDLIGMSIERYLSDVLTPYTTTTSGNPTDTTPPPAIPTSPLPAANNPANAAWPINKFDYRCNGFPTPNRPLTPEGVSRTIPCFVPNCSQFVVEYAGDFMNQNADGQPVPDANGHYFADGDGHGTDGAVDYIVDPTTKRRTIRWYGFPRDTNGDGRITIAGGDVVPVRDYTGIAMPWERLVNTFLPTKTDYAAVDGVAPGSKYYACWGPDTASFPRPKMIRIVMAMDDPASRVTSEQYFEYVFELP